MVKFRVFRFSPEKDRKPRYVDYNIEDTCGLTVLDALKLIKTDMDPSLSFRHSCRSAICGSCAVSINGKNMLACNTQVDALGKSRVVVEPLPGYPVINDLVVDFAPFFGQYRSVQPYLVSKTAPPEKERIQSVEARKKYDAPAQCIMCAACTTSCPIVWTDDKYLGPAALTKVWRFVADSRDDITDERLAMVNNEYGIWRCHTMFRCAEACPKEIDTTEAIENLRREVLKRAFSRRR
ncbi:MAG: succinate dehydrogenase iron-sulfur subunit [Candidatus Thermoplasmatota archaeon]|nr:succinate dehydrogenase iron-sulfur subunit [Candidatus Thermoplasmatota archaeon]